MRAKKPSASRHSKLGQHFLIHKAIAERIAGAAALSQEDTVLEIGPGKGILTRALLARAKKVIAVEADKGLFEGLARTFAKEIDDGRLELVSGDIRDFDPSLLPGRYALVANIPYYLTGEIFRKFLTSAHQPRAMTMLVQKEVAARIARDKKGSLLALSVRAYGTPAYLFTVPKGAFVPPPSVDSAVLSVRDISRKYFASPAEEKRFFAVLRAGFAHKRKFLSSNLREAGYELPGVPEKARAEELSIDEWLAFVKAVSARN